MITPGALLPQKAIQDIKPIEAPPETGLGTEFAASAELGFRHNLLSDEILRARKLINPTDAEQINKEAADRESYLNDEINNMKSGVVPTSVGFIGNILGFAADPNNLLTEFGASALMGPGRAIVARALAQSTKGARVGAEAALGAAQQGLAFTPAALADYDVSNQLGQNPTALNVVANIGLAAGLGAVFHGIGAARKPITTEAHDTALQTATAQTLNGQRVDVAPIVKQGYNEARANEEIPPSTNEPLTYKGKPIQDARTEVDARLNEAKTNYDEALSKDAEKRRNQGLLEGKKPLDDSDVIEKALQISKVSPAARSVEDKLFLDGLPKNEEFQKALGAAQKPEAERTPEEAAHLQAFNQGEEPRMIQDRLEEHQKEISSLQEQLGKVKGDKQKADIQGQLNDLTERVKQGQDRLDQLQGRENETPAIKAARENLEKVQGEDEALKGREVEAKMQQTPSMPVTPQDIEASIHRAQDWRNDSALDPNDMAAFDREAEAVPDENEQILADTESLIDDLRKQDALTEEDKQLLDDLKAEGEKSKLYEAALKALKDCFIGGGK